MYIPKHFTIEDESATLGFVDKFNFGTLVTKAEKTLNANHIPFLVNKQNRQLLGHVAKPNPQWRELEKNPEVLVIFQGPHAYISPSWYVSKDLVPTWNFTAVHVYGKAMLVYSVEETFDIVEQLSAKHEAGFANPWRSANMDKEKLNSMLGAIVGFKIQIKDIQAKAKLSQNRSAKDQASVIDGLREYGGEQALAVASLMESKLAESKSARD